MANILCIETATTNCSVALSVNGSVIALREDKDKGYSHAEKLHVFIEEVLLEAKLSKEQLDAVAVSKGPGSYTGLRIGVSAAKGLCYALDIPLVSISTLRSLANRVETPVGAVIPLLDARRMEVYAGVFSAEIELLSPIEAIIVTEDSFSEQLNKGSTYFIGSGVEKFEAICTHSNAIFIPNELPSALQIGPIAEIKLKKQVFEDVAYFEPYYLKDFMPGIKKQS